MKGLVPIPKEAAIAGLVTSFDVFRLKNLVKGFSRRESGNQGAQKMDHQGFAGHGVLQFPAVPCPVDEVISELQQRIRSDAVSASEPRFEHLELVGIDVQVKRRFVDEEKQSRECCGGSSVTARVRPYRSRYSA
jgi:hypothetical protein